MDHYSSNNSSSGNSLLNANNKSSMPNFKDILTELSEKSQLSNKAIPFIIGKTQEKTPFVIDLANINHLLINGALEEDQIGFINNLISTVAFTKTPKDIQFIIYDHSEKLNSYSLLPYMAFDVINKESNLNQLIKFLKNEIRERKYTISTINSKHSLSNIYAYNRLITNYGYAAPKITQIVIIIKDLTYYELVDESLLSELEDINSLLPIVGIHFLILTNNTISQILRKNQTRILLNSLEVTSQTDLTPGNMIETLTYKNAFTTDKLFLQKLFISENEYRELLKEKVTTNNNERLKIEDIIDEEEYEKALLIVYEKMSASASYLQRRMNIGYNTAAKYVERMEEEGIVGPPNGSKPRELLKML